MYERLFGLLDKRNMQAASLCIAHAGAPKEYGGRYRRDRGLNGDAHLAQGAGLSELFVKATLALGDHESHRGAHLERVAPCEL